MIGLPLQMGVALFLAVLLNQKMKGERLFRMAFYLPVILGFNTAVLLCWRLMLNTGTGIVNQIIRAISTSVPPFGVFSRAFDPRSGGRHRVLSWDEHRKIQPADKSA